LKTDEAVRVLRAAWEAQLTDPMARVVAAADRIVADRIRVGWTAEVVNDLADRRRSEMVEAALPLILKGQFDHVAQNASLATFSAGLETDIQHERKIGGRLRSWSSDDEIAANALRLTDVLWNGVELHCLQRWLTEGERIMSIGVREVRVSSGRKFTRESSLAFMPLLVFEKQFRRTLTSEGALVEKERDIAKDLDARANPWRGSGRPATENEVA
jgi:hypothetical protein